MAGRTIAFEGLDGCGKTTQLQLVKAWLAEQDPDGEHVFLREPGGTTFGEAVRELLLTGDGMGSRAETLLYMASRAELYETLIGPALQRGALVVMDRSYYSTAAYQGAGLELGVDAVLDMARWVTGGRAPDRVVLLRLSPEQALARRTAAGGGEDRIEAREAEYFERVGQAYDALAAREPERFVVIDASAAVERVAADVAEVLRGLV